MMAVIVAYRVSSCWLFLETPSPFEGRGQGEGCGHRGGGPMMMTNSPFFMIALAIFGRSATVARMISSWSLVSSRAITIGRSG